MKEKTLNVQRSTLNGSASESTLAQYGTGAIETEELIRIFLASIRTAEKNAG